MPDHDKLNSNSKCGQRPTASRFGRLKVRGDSNNFVGTNQCGYLLSPHLPIIIHSQLTQLSSNQGDTVTLNSCAE